MNRPENLTAIAKAIIDPIVYTVLGTADRPGEP
jgi:hypothetical protein